MTPLSQTTIVLSILAATSEPSCQLPLPLSPFSLCRQHISLLNSSLLVSLFLRSFEENSERGVDAKGFGEGIEVAVEGGDWERRGRVVIREKEGGAWGGRVVEDGAAGVLAGCGKLGLG